MGEAPGFTTMGFILQKQGSCLAGKASLLECCLPPHSPGIPPPPHPLSLHPSDSYLPATLPPLILIFLLNFQFFCSPLVFPSSFSVLPHIPQFPSQSFLSSSIFLLIPFVPFLTDLSAASFPSVSALVINISLCPGKSAQLHTQETEFNSDEAKLAQGTSKQFASTLTLSRKRLVWCPSIPCPATGVDSEHMETRGHKSHHHCKPSLLMRFQKQQKSFISSSLALLLLLCTRELESGLGSVLALSTSPAAMKLGREERR